MAALTVRTMKTEEGEVWLHSASVVDDGGGLCGALIALFFRKEHHYTLNRGMDGPQSLSG